VFGGYVLCAGQIGYRAGKSANLIVGAGAETESTSLSIISQELIGEVVFLKNFLAKTF
jgi:hypothetical protein